MKYSYVDSIFLAGYFNIITEIGKRNETKRWDRIRQWKEWTGATKKNLVSVNFFLKHQREIEIENIRTAINCLFLLLYETVKLQSLVD